METTVVAIYEKNIEDEPISWNEDILYHEEGIDLLPANI